MKGVWNMSDSIRKQILGVRTKYCGPILEMLAQEGELYHGDLAEKLHMTPSGLNVIIKKMQECDPPIIEIAQIGKYKIYTLPPEVKEYIENTKKAGGNFQKESQQVCEEENVLICMQHFVEKAGNGWRDQLNLLLQGTEEEIEQGTIAQFEKLMSTIVEASKYREDEIGQLERFINNDVLFYLIQEYLNEITECEDILKQICSRENGKKLARHFKIQ